MPPNIRRQKNVQAQVQDRRDQILDTAREYAQHPERFEWLRATLASQSLDPRDGILVELRSVPDQGCWVHYGMWLAGDERFYKFVVDETFGKRSLEGSGRVEQARVDDVTDSTSIEEFLPGTGHSLGYLALGVLRAHRQGTVISVRSTAESANHVSTNLKAR
ncbi:hypothetical protein [Piscinibacterium candidicorallinum]|uniref:Uncharacterized protein n=1 Tax=Piscinibacterium candidicorallinum TaxID=1793872 RepID=A0ABV7H381_9BURK